MVAQKKLATNYTNCTNWFWSLITVAVVVVASSCSSAGPTDVRAVVPGDALVYLETQDLGKALHAVTDNEAFRAAAKSQPDFSALNGIRVGVAVTGFETKDIPTPDGPSVLDVQPRFVAVAETNAWNFQAIKFAENKLGEFVNDVYGGGVELERFPRYDGDYFIWTAQDGRKAYGLVIGSVIFFGNDETAIEKCVAVRKGEAESIAKNSKLPNGDFLASGYVSPDGVAQIANIATIQLAVGAGDGEEVRGFIARVLPEILRKSVNEVSWTATRDEPSKRMIDQFSISLVPDVSSALSGSLAPGDADLDLSRFIPANFVSSTRYNLKDAQIAWRGVLLTARSRTDQVSGSILSIVSASLFEPYGVDDSELFLSSIGSSIQTVKFDADGEEVAGVAKIRDLEKMKRALSKDLDLAAKPESFENAEIWHSKDGEIAIGMVERNVFFGEKSAVEKCLTARNNGQNLVGTFVLGPIFMSSIAPIVTAGTDGETAKRVAAVLGVAKEGNESVAEPYSTETTLNDKGIQRRTVSNLGLIGWVIEQLAKE
ncbi:MAG: hypothetical protein AB7V18_13980 [Pyrinomonadaceae bacterium]